VPKIESVPVHTSYAKMDIALKQISTVKMGDDHETASIDLRNGDKLKGVVSLAPIELLTIFGPVKVGIEHVRRIDVVVSGGGLPIALAVGLSVFSFGAVPSPAGDLPAGDGVRLDVAAANLEILGERGPEAGGVDEAEPEE
jgi:hypothetical protein